MHRSFAPLPSRTLITMCWLLMSAAVSFTTPEMSNLAGEIGDGVGIDALCGQRHVAHHHVLDHALAEWGHLLRGHESTPYEIAAHAAVTIVLS